MQMLVVCIDMTKISLRLVLQQLLAVTMVQLVHGTSSHNNIESITDNLLENAHRTIRPGFDKVDVTVVEVGVYLLRFNDISAKAERISITISLGSSWFDDRLAHNASHGLELSNQDIDGIWRPDIVFENDIEGFIHKVPFPNRLAHIDNNGLVYYETKLSMNIRCQMRVNAFPFDSQMCALIMISNRYPENVFQLKWYWYNFTNDMEQDHPEFKLVGARLYSGNLTLLNGLTKSCLRIDFYLQRNYGFYIADFYIPSTLVVVVSWFSFALDVGSVPGRIFLGIMCIVTMTQQSDKVMSYGIRTSTLRAIDAWLGVCMVFVTAVIIEFVIVNICARSEMWFVVKKRISRFLHIGHIDALDQGQLEKVKRYLTSQTNLNAMWTAEEKAKAIDVFARVAFPTAFILFTLFYFWFWLKDYDWTKVPDDIKELRCSQIDGGFIPLGYFTSFSAE